MSGELLSWCNSVLGPCEIASGEMREHERSSVIRLRLLASVEEIQQPEFCYLKIHHQRSFWNSEVHAYQHWITAFGSHVPKLLAVRYEEPWALIISELPGRSMADIQLSSEQEVSAWQRAGQHLAALHASARGEWFGPCLADGDPDGSVFTDAQTHIANYFDEWTHRGTAIDALTPTELSVIQAARGLIPAFAGERPIPCHRDYCPINWMVNAIGEWCGVIDFEFAQWDVRVADFTRYPNWEWQEKPHLNDAFFDGYGRKLTAREEEQCLVGHVQYALSAIVWGQEASYFGFQKEGQDALKLLAKKL